MDGANDPRTTGGVGPIRKRPPYSLSARWDRCRPANSWRSVPGCAPWSDSWGADAHGFRGRRVVADRRLRGRPGTTCKWNELPWPRRHTVLLLRRRPPLRIAVTSSLRCSHGGIANDDARSTTAATRRENAIRPCRGRAWAKVRAKRQTGAWREKNKNSARANENNNNRGKSTPYPGITNAAAVGGDVIWTAVGTAHCAAVIGENFDSRFWSNWRRIDSSSSSCSHRVPPTRWVFTITADNGDGLVRTACRAVRRSPGTRTPQSLFSPSSFCPSTTMKGLRALRRIKHRLSDDFDAFCHTIFGQTPPPAGKRFLFLLRSIPARLLRVCTIRLYLPKTVMTHTVFTIDPSVFCFHFWCIPRCSS